jgi:multiple sugar transport system permease protein
VPIILALLLQEVPKGKILFRTLFYLPAVTSGLIILFMWKQFYKPDEDGMLNQVAMNIQRGYNGLYDLVNSVKIHLPWANVSVVWIPLLGLIAWGFVEVFSVRRQNVEVDVLRRDTWGVRPAEAITKRTFWLPTLLLFLGGVGLLILVPTTFGGPTKVEQLKWLKDPSYAMLCIILPGIWGRSGPACLIYLAGLKSIPEEEYEAADLDGAGPARKAWNITFPRLSALILINFVGAFIGAFQASQNVLVMTAGGPDNATMIIGLEIWMKAFIAIRFGYATALAWIMGLMLLSFTMYQISVLKKVKFSTAERSAAQNK